ncbi:MAG: Crp/Fnr family transcriptional regulator [Oscillatoriales cyanobacterium C42_A2020_001]|nr:Crp/Fnr family transcriptional regulator [Leptolyngbyaceae cyanobacterium C42_A2020_001]
MPTSLNSSNHCSNRILAALPIAEYDQLLPYLTITQLTSDTVLYKPEELISAVYFPTTAVISIVGSTQEGSSTEIGMIGSEGMVGLPAFFGVAIHPYQVICQLPGEALKLPVEILRDALTYSSSLYRILLRYSYAYLVQLAQSAICNRFHPLEERLCRWLLVAQDRARRDQLQFTQEFLAQMIGARRVAVGLTANTLQSAGLIRYHRGQITILDRSGLEGSACECYQVVRKEFDAFLDSLND